MDIKIEIKLKNSTWGFSDLLGGRELNNQTKKEIIELLKEDIGEVFDQQIEVNQLITKREVDGKMRQINELHYKNKLKEAGVFNLGFISGVNFIDDDVLRRW